MASVVASIAASGPVVWNDTGRTWRLSDLFAFVPGPTTRLSIVSSAVFIVPTHSGVTNPAGNLMVGFTSSTATRPPGGWRASNLFTLTMTLDDGFGVATQTLTTNFIIVAPPILSAPIRDWTLPQSSTDVYVAHLPATFARRFTRSGSTLAYEVASASGGLTARVDASDNLLVSTPAAEGSGVIVITCTASSAQSAPAKLDQQLQDSFAVAVTPGDVAEVVGDGIPQVYMREGETIDYLVTRYFTGAEPRVDSVTATAPVSAVSLGDGVRLTASAPTGNKQDATVSVSVIADDGDAVTATFTASVLKSSVRFDPGTPTASVSTSRQLSVNLPSIVRVPLTPYSGAVISYQIQASNQDTALMRRTTSLPATFDLPAGGAWEVKAKMFLDGFPSRNTRSVFTTAPLAAVGEVDVSVGTAITIRFDYGHPVSAVSDIVVDLFGDKHLRYDSLSAVAGAGATPSVTFTPPTGAYALEVRASVNGQGIIHRENIVFGSPAQPRHDGIDVQMNGVSLGCHRATFDGGVRRVQGGLPRLWSQTGSVRIFTDRPLTDFENGLVTFLIGERTVATLWVESAQERLGARREVRLRLEGRLAYSGGHNVDQAQLAGTQREVLTELCDAVGVPCVTHQDGALLPAHKHTENLARAVSDLQTYGGLFYEDRFGRLAFGARPTLPFRLRTGVDGPTTAAAEDVTTPSTSAGYNSVDAPAQTIEANGERVVSTTYNGDGIGLDIIVFDGFDLSQYLPDVDLLTMTRSGTKATVTPPTDGVRLAGTEFAQYRGAARLSYTADPTEFRLDLLQSDLPVYNASAAVLLARAQALLAGGGRDSRLRVQVVAPFGSSRLHILSQLETGATIAFDGTGYVIEGIGMVFDGGAATADLLLNPSGAGDVTPENALVYDANRRYDDTWVWA